MMQLPVDRQRLRIPFHRAGEYAPVGQPDSGINIE
jgi:hypothetical protein